MNPESGRTKGWMHERKEGARDQEQIYIESVKARLGTGDSL